MSLLLCACHGSGSGQKPESRDSVYTTEHIQKIAFGQPQKALALLDTAEERRLLSPFDISDLRCQVYHNGLSHYKTAYAHALKAYNDPDARRDPGKLLSLLGIMAEECHTNGDYTGSVEHCAEGLELAGQTGDRTAMADLHVTWGLNLLEMAQYDEAFRQIDLAIGILEDEVRREPCYRTWDGLFYALGMKLNLLWEKDRYDEALAMRPSMEEALQGLETAEDTPEGVAGMRRAETDVCYCCIAYTLGRKAEGDSLFRRVEANPYASTPDGEYVRIPCLLLARRYGEALHYLQREKQRLRATTDTVNWDYIDPHLQMELEAYQGLGDWRSASRTQSVMQALADTLRRRERHEDALELAELYESEEKDALIREQRLEAGLWRVVSGAAILLLLAGAGFALVIVRKNREISRRNLALAEQVKAHLADRKELDRKIEESLALRDGQEKAKRKPGTARGKDAAREEALPEEGGSQASEMDRVLFERVSYEIRHRRLFRDPGFSRTELLKIVPVPQNKFAGLFKQFAGMPFTAYVRDLRLGYANELFIEHPDWSMDAIIKECGMQRSSFYASFIQKFGVNPDELRKNLQKGRNNDDSIND